MKPLMRHFDRLGFRITRDSRIHRRKAPGSPVRAPVCAPRRPNEMRLQINPLMNLRFTAGLIGVAVLGAALAACSPTPQRPLTVSTEQHAVSLAAAGKPAAAAELYLKAAQAAKPPARGRLQMQAAKQLIDAQRYDRARKALLAARIELALRQPKAALATLPTELSGLPHVLAAAVLRMRARAAEEAGLTLVALRARLDRQPLLQNQDARNNLHALWALFTKIPPGQLRTWEHGAQREDVRAWVALALIGKTTAPQQQALTQAIDTWKARYPHEQQVAKPIIDELHSQWLALRTYPAQIAVLLPLSGPFSPVAHTILDGIMSAYYAHRDPAHPISLRVYNTGTRPADLLSTYARAISNGAKFIIGPLDRNQVNRLANSAMVTVPTLALNYADSGTPLPANFYEFGLSPGNEAKQVAEKAALDGHYKAVVLVPANDWGKRIAAAFRQRFRQLGGDVLAVGRYQGGAADFSPTIVRALNIDKSTARARAVANTIGSSFKFDARRRQDVDMIFIAGDPRQARLLMPQIAFHHGTGLPVYSISAAYSGTRDALADHDLNGLTFCDAPLLLADTGPDAAARTAMHRHFPNASRRYPRLFGLGVDSFNVIPYLKRLSAQDWARYDGLSGALHMIDGHRLERQLTWASFSGGIPHLLRATYGSSRPSRRNVSRNGALSAPDKVNGTAR